MRQIILEIEDSAYEQFMGMLGLCPSVKVVSESSVAEVASQRDQCMLYAIQTLRANCVFRFGYDYAWIMKAISEGVSEEFGEFRSPQSFLDYLDEMGIDGLPARTTLSRACSKTFGCYPDWRFIDIEKPSEILRRKNVVKQFLSAFGEAKRKYCIKNCTK